MNEPFYSICIPTYNSERYLERCLNSIKGQSFSDWEVVVVDDCSTDATPSIIRNQAIIPEDKLRFELLDKNVGPFDARRRAFEIASGRIIICLDSDDELRQNDSLMLVYQAFEETCCDIVMFNMSSDLSGNQMVIDYNSLFGSCLRIESKQLIKSFSSSYMLNNLASKAIPRSLLIANPIRAKRSLSVCEDRLEVFGVLMQVELAIIINEPLYYYRQNEQSTSHSEYQIDHFSQKAHVEELICDELESRGLEVDSNYVLFLTKCIYDMCDMAHGQPVKMAAARYEAIVDNPFLVRAYKEGDIGSFRFDMRMRLELLMGRRFISAAVFCKIVNCLNSIRKRAK